jgi:hypothetical protein
MKGRLCHESTSVRYLSNSKAGVLIAIAGRGPNELLTNKNHIQKATIMSEFTCPKCKSENTQRLSAIVASGTSHAQSQSVGSMGGTVGGSAAFGVTSSTTTTLTQSALAKKLAAPTKKATILLLCGFAFLMLLAWGMFGKIVGTLGAVALGYFAFMLYQKNSAFNANVLPGLLE